MKSARQDWIERLGETDGLPQPDRPAGRDIEKAGGDEIGWAYMVYVSSLEDTDSPVPSSADAFFAGYQAALEREKGTK